MPKNKGLFYAGEWHAPKSGQTKETFNPGNGEVIDMISQASAEDVNAAVEAAHQALPGWKTTLPAQRAATLRKAANVMREHAAELALLDAYNTGNPIAEMLSDANVAVGIQLIRRT